MKIGFATHQVGAYQIATPLYEGPLDLLLQLIEKAELDITKLALAEVTDQYLAHMNTLASQEPDEVSAFLVIATRLLQIKSEALLPRPPARHPEEEDPGEALARQLMTYKRFKEIAGILKNKEAEGLRTYLRLAPPPKVETKIDLSNVSIEDILQAARQAFIRADNRQELGTVVSPPRVTIREKITAIVHLLRHGKNTTFRTLLGARRSRLDVVVTFLALLELVKRHFVDARQESLFGDIALEPSNTWDDDLDFELEFGE
jgi:segregation and condensation protein A